MDTSIVIRSIVVLLLVLLSAFFSSAETAMTTVSRIRVQSLAEQGDKRAALLERIIADSGKMLSTILIGNNIVNMAVSALVTTLTIDVLGSRFVGAATGLLTLVILLFGEITPKSMAAVHAERFALSYARSIYVLLILLTPVVFVVGKLSGGIIRLFGIDPNAKSSPLTEHELRTLVNESQKDGVIEREEKQMIYNVFDFGDSTAKDVMIPRVDMTFVEVNCTRQELLDIFREDRHTRFPVYEEDTDNVIAQRRRFLAWLQQRLNLDFVDAGSLNPLGSALLEQSLTKFGRRREIVVVEHFEANCLGGGNRSRFLVGTEAKIF